MVTLILSPLQEHKIQEESLCLLFKANISMCIFIEKNVHIVTIPLYRIDFFDTVKIKINHNQILPHKSNCVKFDIFYLKQFDVENLEFRELT